MPAATPDTEAVVRQPFAFIDHTTRGTANPPAAKPKLPVARARARRRSNHRTIATVTVRKPLSPAPIAMKRNDAKNSHRLCIRLNHTNPAIRKNDPILAIRLGPYRSSSQPWSGPSNADSNRFTEKAADRTDLLHPNCRSRTTR